MRFVSSPVLPSILLNLALRATLSLGAPQVPHLPTKDAPFTDSKSQMVNAITCPNGLTGAKNGIVLLVPGTTISGRTSYGNGPYVNLLPKALEVDVCWVDPPHLSMSDAQVGGEYVAHAINHLSKKSKTGKVKVLGHSQAGGISIPWALIFFPSARSKVSSFVALAGDFHGTVTLKPVCLVETLASFAQGCAPAVLQQIRGSKLLTAQNKIFTHELVPTTSIFSRLDELVIPQVGPNTSSRLQGSTQFPLQDFCGPAHLAGHISILADPAAYAGTLDAFTSPSGKMDVKTFDKSQCTNFKNKDLDYSDLASTLTFFSQAGISGIFSEGVWVKEEPALKQYVCDTGAATECGKRIF